MILLYRSSETIRPTAIWKLQAATSRSLLMMPQPSLSPAPHHHHVPESQVQEAVVPVAAGPVPQHGPHSFICPSSHRATIMLSVVLHGAAD